MLFSLALILIIGFTLSGILNRLRLPGILGMLVTGVILGPFVLNLISPDILNISKDLRQIALIVILSRAGLSLDVKDLKKVGRPAILMCFVPATFELVAITLLAPILFKVSYIEAAIMGTVLAAVSPAVVVPRMLKVMEGGYGKEKSIPQLILAGASVDDVYVIVLFTAFMGMYQGKGFSVLSLAAVPISIVVGLAIGILSGLLLVFLFKKLHIRDTVKILIILSVSFLFVTLESEVKAYIPMSGLLAVMALGGTILKKYEVLAKRLSNKFSKVWVGAEILLFVLVGAAVDIRFVSDAGLMAVILILSALIFRICGVYICLIKTKLTNREKLFCAIAYLPKATVQAAIGSIPLSAGVLAGNTILTVAVLAILITAPIGAIGIDRTYKKLLIKS
ncbi:cation:proton antiporter [Clostridium algidicarnis]|uniref:cation:proton antiporter n=1 Tax=Clostridium algidicarnis TaxID=37659 RepID=UPI001C0C0510|nr:cation:proton antiporter [Clostridium algidicarnis]MBU3203877.1 cation:proton antiporter [Clostridium algidicarnis]MBU3209715.1 cation:proton antiporter [Clostridium algidicarnis]MBU3212031.1 cation:proton antiporter [Clostridium algidicarnis]MBU3221463.1 cation:proton antiporter [Clostridium algidicarnis]